MGEGTLPVLPRRAWKARAKSTTMDARRRKVKRDLYIRGCELEEHVAYEVFFVGGKRRHCLAKSADGGQTLSAPVAITPVFDDLRFNSG